MTNRMVLAFFAGCAFRDLTRWVWSRFLAWKFEREFDAAQKRMIGCKHTYAARVNFGGDHEFMVDKCLNCWALYINDEWAASTAPPPNARRT